MDMVNTIMVSPTAWCIIVRHNSVMNDTALVLRLLCVSRALRAVIAEQCGGSLQLAFLRMKGMDMAAASEYCFPSARLAGCAQWLTRHGQLLAS